MNYWIGRVVSDRPGQVGRKFWGINFAGKPNGFEAALFSFSAAVINHLEKGARGGCARVSVPIAKQTLEDSSFDVGIGAFEMRAGNRYRSLLENGSSRADRLRLDLAIFVLQHLGYFF